MTGMDERVINPISRRVISAKSSLVQFEQIEQFQRDNKLNSRNDAILILIATGLVCFGKLSSEEISEIVEGCALTTSVNPKEVGS